MDPQQQERERTAAQALAAWQAAYDAWEVRDRAIREAMGTGHSSESLQGLMVEADQLLETARELFDQYVQACGGRVDSSPGELGPR